MPRLWSDTIEAHRREVHNAVLDATAKLVAERGLRGVTMSAVAEVAKIGRATLYKYFADVESILVEWHEQQIAGHLAALTAAAERAGDPAERLRAVLERFALMTFEWGRHSPSAQMLNTLHRGREVSGAEEALRRLISELVASAVASGHLRDDVPVEELSVFSLHAAADAQSLASRPAVRRRIDLVMAGLTRQAAES